MTYSKDALFLSELSRAQRPEVDVGFPACDDVGAVARVKLHRKHGLVGALKNMAANITWMSRYISLLRVKGQSDLI